MRGSLRKINGKFVTTIDVGINPKTGKRQQQKRVHKTEQAADALLATMLAQVQADNYIPPTKIRTGEFLERWLRDYAGSTVNAVTFSNYRDNVHKQIIPELGAIPLRHLTPGRIQAFYAKELARPTRAGKPRSPATVRKTAQVLTTALGVALREGLVTRNAAALASPPRGKKRRVPQWDVEQLALFFGECRRSRPHRYPVFLTAIGGGMRQGELIGFKWPNLDWATGTAFVREKLYRLGGKQLEGPPKTEAGFRPVPLGPEVLEALREVERTKTEQKRLLGPDYHDRGFVFAQPNGKPLHGHNLNRRDLRGICERAGIPRLRFQDIRHLHATYCALANVPVRVTQERMGHSSSRITQEIYQHTLSTQHQQAALDVEAALFGRNVVERGPGR
jgi:integrase